MIKDGKISIPDDFYIKYSFIHDFDYDSDTEIEIIKNILKDNNLPHDDANILDALNIIRDIFLMIDVSYPDEFKKYLEWRKKQIYVRGKEPIIISLAKEIFKAIIATLTGFTLSKYLNKEKDEEKEIIEKIIKEMDKNEEHKKIIVKIQKKYEVLRE